jgi:hypothetical protein
MGGKYDIGGDVPHPPPLCGDLHGFTIEYANKTRQKWETHLIGIFFEDLAPISEVSKLFFLDTRPMFQISTSLVSLSVSPLMNI